MKKLCNKISSQLTVTVPGINNSIFRRSPSREEDIASGTNRQSSGSYDLEKAQKEYDMTQTVTQEIASSDDETNYENAELSIAQDELYTEIDVDEKKTVVSKTLSECNNQYEYDVPKICFSFFEGDGAAESEPETQKTEKHKSEVKIVLSQPSSEDVENKKSGSDPSVYESALNDDDDDFYKVPKSINKNRLSQSLADFCGAEENFSATSIEHISCSQVIVEPDLNKKLDAHLRVNTKLTLLRPPRNKWTNFKQKINKILEETQPSAQKFYDKQRMESAYRNSRDKCKKMFKSTGKIFKKKDQENLDPNIVKNDAFFAKVNLKASDIEYVLPITSDDECKESTSGVNSHSEDGKVMVEDLSCAMNGKCTEITPSGRGQGQNGFDDLRRYVKQGSDFCKELASILQERSEAETQYAKSLSKLSSKLTRACRDGVGDCNDAWKVVAIDLEGRAEAHRHLGNVLLEETAKPLKTLTENQHRSRKHVETVVDKSGKILADWRAAEAKSKKLSHACARENEKLQDCMLENRLSRSTSLIQLPNMNKSTNEKDNAKFEVKKKKAEDAVKKADIEYYSHCVRAERARLEWETAVIRGSETFQTLEEERLNNLKLTLSCYLNHNTALTPKLIEATNKIKSPIENAKSSKDLTAFISLRQSSQQISEQLLPDFYCEHITLAMNRERRKQALIKLLHLIKADIGREHKSRDGLENLSKAIKQTPNFGGEDSQQSVSEKMHHMKSLLTYLEGARYKVQNALAELDSRPRSGHPLASHITVTRDKAGLQQSILKIPQWLRDQDQTIPMDLEKTTIESKYDSDSDWFDRGTADGNSIQPDSDFDEFSSDGGSICEGNICSTEESPVKPIAQAKVVYNYTPNLPDELAIRVGETVSVYRQQEDGWWLGECNGIVGIFPATYVETLKA